MLAGGSGFGTGVAGVVAHAMEVGSAGIGWTGDSVGFVCRSGLLGGHGHAGHVGHGLLRDGGGGNEENGEGEVL